MDFLMWAFLMDCHLFRPSKTFIYYPIIIVSVKSGLLPENYKFLEAEELFYNFISKSIRGELLFKEILDFFFYC